MRDIEIPLGKRTPKYRFFEMLPAIVSFLMLLIPIVLSVINPLVAAIFILSYVIMWFVKAIAMTSLTVHGYRALHKAMRVNWKQRLDDLEDVDKALRSYQQHQRASEWQSARHYKNLSVVVADRQKYYRPSDIYNVVMLPMYKEAFEIVDETIQSILRSHYDPKHIILMIGYEERAGEPHHTTAKRLADKYQGKFYHVEAIMHPKDRPNEVAGKGGNITYAAHRLEKWVKQEGLDPDKLIVTTLDADNHPHPSYFAYVTYEYILDLEHKHRAYQPVSLYLNNIWDVPAATRVMATGNTFWTILSSQRQHTMRNFSSHAQGLSSLIETDFWSVRTVVEDGHQFWRSYFRFDGDYEVMPIYVPIYQDAVLDVSYVKSVKAQFIQLRRWAYGVSDVAFAADKGFRRGSKVPKLKFLGRFLGFLEGHVSWASASVIIMFGAWAPLFLSRESSRSIVAHELPIVVSWLLRVAMVGLLVLVFLSFKMLPPRPARYKRRRNLLMVLQWVLMPVTAIAYGSAAAFNAQGRLLLGKYLDKFDVTVKTVKK